MEKMAERAWHLLADEVIHGWEMTVKLLPNLIVASIVMLISFKTAKICSILFRRLLIRFSVSGTILGAFSGGMYYFVIALGVFVALDVLDLNRLVVSLLAGAGVVGLALSFAFQDLATNFISGIFIAFQRPFKTGDWVETNGYIGSVVEIGIRSVKIKTEDGQDVIIPSKEIFQNPLKNYLSSPERLITLSVGVSYHDDLRKVQKVVQEVIFALPETDNSKEISVSFYQFGTMSIDFWVKFWIKTGEHRVFLKAQSDAVVAINEAFARNNITIPAAKTGIMLQNNDDIGE